MSHPNGVASPLFIFILVFTSLFFPKFVLVFGSSPAEERSFKRSDPLPHSKYYNGTYDVTNKHYWASAAFTGVHGYVIAGIWMLSGLGFGISMIFKTLKSTASSPAIHLLDGYYVFMFLLVLLFTFLAILATSFVLAENHNFLNKTQKLKNTIMKSGQDVRTTIKKVINSMRIIQHLLHPYELNTTRELSVTSHRLGNASRAIRRFVLKNGHTIDLTIRSSYKLHLVGIIFNLVLVVTGLVLLLLHWHPGFITIIVLCWILTTLFWVMTGFDFFLHTFSEDTCSAFENFIQNPQNNSLKSILPCIDSSNSDGILTDIGRIIHTSIAKMNSKITNVYRVLGLNRQNNDISEFGKICNPFSEGPNYTYNPGKCPRSAIPIGELSLVLSRFTCYKENSTKSCRRQRKIIPQKAYDKALAYSQSLQDMLKIYPDLKSLTECTILKDTFADVVMNQCKSFKVSIQLLWSSMLSLSIFMVTLVVIWVVRAFQEKGRCFSRCSIVPNSSG
ncbi:uncharacterized protein LOC116131399 [Pistacia vera]|uniref:uncharacterized protein LOC116131399 n=1 Tax=Pistacia vera TaxID=55513 RepID=UPI0012632F16|nr:uncharacterized protein LOC116131399 [Pistacia vera]